MQSSGPSNLRSNLDAHYLDLDMTPPDFHNIPRWQASSSRLLVGIDALPNLFPDTLDMDLAQSTTSSLHLSRSLNQCCEFIDNLHQSSFELDSLVALLCIQGRVRMHGGIRPLPSPDASPVPSCCPSVTSAADDKSFRCLDHCEVGSPSSLSNDTVDQQSGAPVLRAPGLQYKGFPCYCTFLAERPTLA